MTNGAPPGLTIRAAEPADEEAVLGLLSTSLGWSVDDRFRRYFRWKHGQSPLGPSPAWVAVEHDAIVGYRAVLRWPLEAPGGRPVDAARAVDVATAPSARGRGVFTALTAHAIEALRASGTELIFTTPNDKAGGGWRKAGAHALGAVPVAVRPRSVGAVLRMVRAREAASRWPEPTTVGAPAAEALTDPGVEGLLLAQRSAIGLRTRRTGDYLRWRYGLDLLGYRVLALDGDPARGIAVFRLRRRGAATEAALCEVLTPGQDARAARSLERLVARSTGADYVIKVASGRSIDRVGAATLPGQGPRLYALPLVPNLPAGDLRCWDLGLGDVELL